MNSAIDREADIRARLQQHWEASERGDVDAEHAIYAADAILDYPQSGERFRGRSRIQAQRGGHRLTPPSADLCYAVRRHRSGQEATMFRRETQSRDHLRRRREPFRRRSAWRRSTLRGSLVTHETQYFADPFHAPPGRAALAEPIPARENKSRPRGGYATLRRCPGYPSCSPRRRSSSWKRSSSERS